MRTDIVIVTYRRDLEYTRFCLFAIQKFAHGFGAVILIVPTTDEKLFLEVSQQAFGETPILVRTFQQVPNKGFLHHEAMVCCADQFTEADYMVHIDADCIFHAPVIPQDYFVNEKPVMLKELFSRLNGNVMHWQLAVEKALGWKPEYETMRRHPSVHPRWLYPAMRATVEARHRLPFVDYVLTCRNEYPQGFAEFPSLGAWALRYAPKAHHWIEVGTDPIPPHKLTQFWSHGGVDMVWPPDGKNTEQTVRSIVEKLLA